jgi:uncharacterized protein (DUF1800 family)
MKKAARVSVFLLVCLGLVGVAAPADAAILVMVPWSASLRAGMQQQFSSYVFFAANTNVTWRINGIPGGNVTVGTISSGGLYTAPSVPPIGAVTVTATSVADPAATSSSTITVLNPVPSISSLTPASIAPGPFVLTVDGSGFVPTSTVRYGAVPLKTTWVSTTRLTASGDASLVAGGMMAIRVANADPGASVSAPVAVNIEIPMPKVSALAARRFLEQVSWGPDPASIARVQQLGFEAYLDEQMAQAPSTYPDYGPSNVLVPVQQRFVFNALTGADQLRQRIAFVLGQIFVVTGWKELVPEMFVPYLRLLEEHAFDNYATLLRKVTLNPTMGNFLDMVDNEKANLNTRALPNENYARELLQLFTIGTDRLNPDGTKQLDSYGDPIPTYDQALIENLARVFTGWTYPTKPGAVPQPHNWPYFLGEMEPVASNHDTGEKILFNSARLPAGQSPEEDLSGALEMIVNHPNAGPFLARRLIQQLVTSNPSPAYVARVSAAFAGGGGTPGDLRNVIKAIVLDPEARRGDIQGGGAPLDGHLREPLLNSLALFRTLGSRISETSYLAVLIAPAGQTLFYPASVFNYFSPLYTLPESGVPAPEFQIFTPSAAVYRANVASWSITIPEVLGASTDITPFEQLADDPSLLVEAVNRALLYGRMSLDMRQSVAVAVAAVSSSLPKVRAQTALYLVASSSDYQVTK